MTLSLDKFHQHAVDDASPKVAVPAVNSFREFLETHARVKTPDGNYAPYTFAGREALEFVVGIIDRVLGNDCSRETLSRHPSDRECDSRLQMISDARLTATGSAQWGKTILELNLLAYLTGLQFRSVGLFLPDEDLVQGVVDSKFRPDVLDQLPWLNSLITLGKAENASGKTVNRKGLFTCTDGHRKSHGMIHGMQKIPTTFSFDVVIEDEKDDIPPRMSRYLTARMTASDLRFRLSIGTQRYAGAGQNKEFEAGTMHVGWFTCPRCGHKQNPEENWPGVCRLAIDGEVKATDPQLQMEGNFRRKKSEIRIPKCETAEEIYDFSPDSHFYLACVRCGRTRKTASLVRPHLATSGRGDLVEANRLRLVSQRRQRPRRDEDVLCRSPRPAPLGHATNRPEDSGSRPVSGNLRSLAHTKTRHGAICRARYRGSMLADGAGSGKADG
jgi:hypothetical protein